MTITEAAKLLNCSERTIRRAIKTGQLEAKSFTTKHGRKFEINSESFKIFRTKWNGESIYPENQTTQSLKAINDTGKLGTTLPILSSEKIETFITNLNSFINIIKNRDDQGRQISDLPDVCNTLEASKYLRISQKQVRDLIRRGELQGTRLGKGLKISRYSLELFRKKKLGR